MSYPDYSSYFASIMQTEGFDAYPFYGFDIFVDETEETAPGPARWYVSARQNLSEETDASRGDILNLSLRFVIVGMSTSPRENDGAQKVLQAYYDFLSKFYETEFGRPGKPFNAPWVRGGRLFWDFELFEIEAQVSKQGNRFVRELAAVAVVEDWRQPAVKT